MVSFEIIRPADIPSRLLSFKFYFENLNTHIIDLYHAGGMNLAYYINKLCYIFPQNEFYELLKLQNIEELHEPKYNWLLMKGMFAGQGNTAVDIEIENEETLNLLHPNNNFNKKSLFLSKLPEQENEIVIGDTDKNIFHHFLYIEVFAGSPGSRSFITMTYLNSYYDIYQIINLWFNDENKLLPLP